MLYSNYGRTGVQVSALGFGVMHMPVKDGRIDRELAIPLLRRGVQLGINYYDTAPNACAACGICEGKCPQKLPIMDRLKEAHGILG